jgi:hypothetical protein
MTNERPMRSARPQATLLCDMELPLHKRFFPLGFGVEVLTNRPEVLEAAEASFGHRRLRRGSTHLQIRIGISDQFSGRSPQLPIRREYNHLYSIVADAENQALLDLHTGANFVWLSKSAIRDDLYLRHNFLEKVVYLLLGASVVTDLHAACVSKEGKGILLCGDSGAGKSTLAYGCARTGWTYTSDDTCYLVNGRDVPLVIGHSHRVRFRPSARDLFPELRDHKITPRMEGKPSIEAPVSTLLPINRATEATVSAVVYLRRSPSTHARLIELPFGSATRRLSAELYSAGEIRAKHEQVLSKLVETPAFELFYDSLEDGIAQLNQLAVNLSD